MKKILLAVCSVIFIVAIGVASFVAWDYYHPEVSCYVQRTENLPLIVIAGPNYKYSVNKPSKILECQIRHIIKSLDGVSQCFNEKYGDCKNNIYVTITIKDDTTNFNFHGTIKDGEKEIEYNEDLLIDSVITTDYTGNCELRKDFCLISTCQKDGVYTRSRSDL